MSTNSKSYFESERERLTLEITKASISSQGFEQLLSSSNDLNRKLEEALGMTREYDNIAELWNSFHQLMRQSGSGQGDSNGAERGAGLPGTGGHIVKESRSQP
ncbi:hypothetical protein PUNSTDRAFT_61654 [Punctularia strigosozonata HHB-11173 SS5]|uniref:uncharacterized protein n=1 Tax=Punctularia strigosozonata (strain HHB-11173) TaxID=741275 RepID=UPI0004417366|nr:uncharacterized protein PUNSTDRAFT_61654 [Punctularia strigosozonata HHB-11173 SS5]EIN12828.1 hypothetical protein PUNSTDRAFT_61654 [Punctularia strigosozonata HHB-11173 SS5]